MSPKKRAARPDPIFRLLAAMDEATKAFNKADSRDARRYAALERAFHQKQRTALQYEPRSLAGLIAKAQAFAQECREPGGSTGYGYLDRFLMDLPRTLRRLTRRS